MKTLNQQEIQFVSGGEVKCTAGIDKVVVFKAEGDCDDVAQVVKDTANSIKESVKDLYDSAVEATADAMCSATGNC